MDESHRINRFLVQHAQGAWCDECIASRLGLAGRPQVFRAIRALAATPDFRCDHGRCAGCGQEKRVTGVDFARRAGADVTAGISALELLFGT